MNKLSIWLKAARPKTLPASACPVVVASALAYKEGHFNIVIALLCLVVALSAQIASNYANDYFDFKKGSDTNKRLGPERAVAKGWVTANQMLIASCISALVAAISGICISYLAGWWLVVVGIVVIAGIFAYSSGPFPLSRKGFGEIAVLVFFGIVPVCGTFYAQSHTLTLDAFLLSIAVGVLSSNILIINNYRDYEEDRSVGKKTLIVRLGKTFGRYLYLFNVVIALLISGIYYHPPRDLFSIIITLLFPVICFLILKSWLQLKKEQGGALNKTLALTGLILTIYSIFVSLSIISV